MNVLRQSLNPKPLNPKLLKAETLNPKPQPVMYWRRGRLLEYIPKR